MGGNSRRTFGRDITNSSSALPNGISHNVGTVMLPTPAVSTGAESVDVGVV